MIFESYLRFNINLQSVLELYYQDLDVYGDSLDHTPTFDSFYDFFNLI